MIIKANIFVNKGTKILKGSRKAADGSAISYPAHL
jgi:hypothetical protein